MAKKTWEPCEEDCKGWHVFTSTGSFFYEDGKLCIQKCDEADRFESDQEAQDYALKTARDEIPGETYLYNSEGYVCTVRTYRSNPRRWGRRLHQ